MLESLSVRNYVLIDELNLDFSEGFTALTGETGSGKSIILGALSLLLGAKADKDEVRMGAESAEISGVFSYNGNLVPQWLEEHGALSDGELVIRRKIRVNGKSLYTVNGVNITRQEGQDLGFLLVDISSQHEHQSLLRESNLRYMVDQASGTLGLTEEYKKSYNLMKAKQKQVSESVEKLKKAQDEEEYIRFCLNELEGADIKPGEDEKLKNEIDLISSSEFLMENLSSSGATLRESLSAMNTALMYLKKANKKDANLTVFVERLESASIEGEDIAESIRDYMSSFSFSEYELEEKNQRLSQLQKIKRRFGPTLSDAINKRDEYRERLSLLEVSSDVLCKLEKEVSVLSEATETLASKLSEKRKKGALKLQNDLENTLKRLAMRDARLEIVISDTELGPSGKDKVTFMLQSNKGESSSPLQNASSGGELSRILLALKVNLKGDGSVPCMIFDEIDSGLGGKTASVVADELLALSKREQVIAITHLPQIASRADEHLLVLKREEKGRTVSSIRRITGDERVREIARLLSGETSDISLDHAKSLLKVKGPECFSE